MAGALPNDVCDTLAALSQGNPFMVAAVLHGLVESGTLTYGSGTWHVDKAALHEGRAHRGGPASF